MDGVTKTTLPLKSIIKYVNPCLSVLNVKQEQHSDAFFNSIKFNPIVYTSFERVQDTWKIYDTNKEKKNALKEIEKEIKCQGR